MIDLFAYVPCKHINATLSTLLKEKYNSLGISKIDFKIETHVYKDPGLFNEDSIAYRLQYQKHHPKKFLVILDESWDGSPKAKKIKIRIKNELLKAKINEEDFHIVVIEPELEQWIWTKKPTHLAKLFNTNEENIRNIANIYNYDFTNKPKDPKELFIAMLKYFEIPHSADCFRTLVKNCSFEKCTDANFLDLRTILHNWFPTEKEYLKTIENTKA